MATCLKNGQAERQLLLISVLFTLIKDEGHPSRPQPSVSQILRFSGRKTSVQRASVLVLEAWAHYRSVL